MEDRTLDSRMLLALAAVAAIVIGVSMCGGADTSSPDAAVRSYFSAIADGEEACAIATEGFRAEAVETAESGADEAVVEVTIESGDFPTDPLRFDVVRDEDGWLVADLEEPTTPAG